MKPETTAEWETTLMMVVIAGINFKLKDGQQLTESQRFIFEAAPKELFIPKKEWAK